MNKKEIKKSAISKIKEGKTRQQAFEEIRDETKESAEDIAKIVRFIPTLQARKKFKIANTILGIILILTVLIKMLAGLPIILELGGAQYLPLLLLLPIINIILTIGVFRYNGSYYRLVIFLTIIGLLNSMKYIIGEEFDPLILIDLGIAGVLIGLSSYLGNKLVSSYDLTKVKHKTDSGKVRIKQVIRFNDEYIKAETLDTEL